MVRFESLAALVGPLVILFTSGCAICQAPDDCNYSAYGGIAPRVDMRHGRVGSAFDPADGGILWSESEPTPSEPNLDQPGTDEELEAPDAELGEPDAEGLETAY